MTKQVYNNLMNYIFINKKQNKTTINENENENDNVNENDK